MVITLLMIIIHIANVPCSDLKFTCKAQSLVSFQRTLSASEISSRFYCLHFRITCNYFRISHYPYLISLELCYSAISLLSGPDNPHVMINSNNNNSGLMRILMLTILSCGIHQGAQSYLFCMNLTQGHSYLYDISFSSPKWS